MARFLAILALLFLLPGCELLIPMAAGGADWRVRTTIEAEAANEDEGCQDDTP